MEIKQLWKDHRKKKRIFHCSYIQSSGRSRNHIPQRADSSTEIQVSVGKPPVLNQQTRIIYCGLLSFLEFLGYKTVGWIHFELGGEEGLHEGIKKPPHGPEWQYFVPDLCQTIPKATESTTGIEQLLTEGLILNTKKGKKERQPLLWTHREPSAEFQAPTQVYYT